MPTSVPALPELVLEGSREESTRACDPLLSLDRSARSAHTQEEKTSDGSLTQEH